MDEPPSTDVDVCILGAGPHGLAAAIHLHEAAPHLKVTALDPQGTWLSTWNNQFDRAMITTLRSPIVHHPSPDPSALMRFVDQHELERSGLQYDVPMSTAFRSFCDALVRDAELSDPIAAQPHAIHSDGRRVHLDLGAEHIDARHVVVATNPHRRHIPEWTWPLLGHRPGLVEYASDVDLRDLPDLGGQVVAVIGGGLTAAHLACGAIARGAEVHLIARNELRLRGFDTDPGWLGPKFLRDFFSETDTTRRLEIAREARGGGSMPHWMHDRLTDFTKAGMLTVHEATEVDHADIDAEAACQLQLTDGGRLSADRVWLATGTEPDINALRALRPVLDDVPTIDGLPVVDERLRLGPHPIYVMGRLTTIALGPAAGNLWGAQRAARRITATVTGVDLDYETVATVPRPPGGSASLPD